MPNGDEGRAEFERELRRKAMFDGDGERVTGDQAGPASNPPGEADENKPTPIVGRPFSVKKGGPASNPPGEADEDGRVWQVGDIRKNKRLTEEDIAALVASGSVVRAGPASNPPGEADQDRFSDKDRETAQDFARAYIGRITTPRQPEVIEGIGIEGGDDDARLVVGRASSNVGPDYGVLRKGIIADPVTGRGDARGPGYEPDTWPLPSSPRDPAWETPPPPNKPPVELKDTNPKDAVGIRKWRVFTTIPFTIIWELGVAMLEGARKYGRHNYRVAGVRGSVYVDAAMGHITQWWEGEDIDVESGLSHITKAIASLAVMRDAMINGKFVDDRPPKVPLENMRKDLQGAVDGIFERIVEAQPAYLEGDQFPGRFGSGTGAQKKDD